MLHSKYQLSNAIFTKQSNIDLLLWFLIKYLYSPFLFAFSAPPHLIASNLPPHFITHIQPRCVLHAFKSPRSQQFIFPAHQKSPLTNTLATTALRPVGHRRCVRGARPRWACALPAPPRRTPPRWRAWCSRPECCASPTGPSPAGAQRTITAPFLRCLWV